MVNKNTHVLYCIIGRTASGKDTVSKELQKEGMKAVCSYATRPIRDNETEGVEHYFISDEEMQNILQTKKIAAYTKIEDPNSGVKGYEYCATADEVFKSDIYVIDPIGLLKLKEEMKESIDNGSLVLCPIYIQVNYDIRLQRLLNSGRGDEAIQSFKARNMNENAQFVDIEKNPRKYGVDFIAYNNSTTEELMDTIHHFITTQKLITGTLEKDTPEYEAAQSYYKEFYSDYDKSETEHERDEDL